MNMHVYFISQNRFRVLHSSVCCAVLLFAALEYYSEELQFEFVGEVERPSDFKSIPGTFWYTMVTMMTVGYGDQVPVTTLGKVVAGLSMIGAVVLMALPISVIGTQFTQHWVNYKKQAKREARTVVAYETLCQLVDNLSDHTKVRT